ncbi:P-type Ca2+ transporter type 2C [Nematocida sp. LUAm3]|nr:P-type Ca2+ transporter type 2C [Nematocida sp. LUAm3]KAI5174696.1 P-type Ca2+ transporter type 2C [Nematocida sp. LUAm2]KAI5177893.1 P-type Ca2+ transporter type 2C [Nematocida sp. LUAm1]
MKRTLEKVEEILKEQNVKKIEEFGGVEEIEKELLLIENRKEVFGENYFDILDRSFSIGKAITNQYKDRTLSYLTILSFVSIFIGIYEYVHSGAHSYVDGISILLATIFLIVIGCVSEYIKSNTVQELEKSSQNVQCKILRNNEKILVNSTDILVGDRVYVEAGDIIPADLLYIKEDANIFCDDSIVTGESELSEKSRNSPYFFSGSEVVSGSGVGLVIGVGSNSSKGKLFKMVKSGIKRKSPHQRKMERLVDRLALFGISFSVLIFLINLLRGALGYTYKPLLTSLFEAIGLAAVAIPEGLPVAVGMSQVYAAFNMYRNHALVRNISKCETMNSTTVICIDKTGTLTKNTMTVRSIFSSGVIYDRAASIDGLLFCEVIIGILVNSTAFINEKGTHGSKTEVALLDMLMRENLYYRISFLKSGVLPFTSSTKYMSTSISSEEMHSIYNQIGYRSENYRDTVYFKGAPEIILSRCSHMLTPHGVVPMDQTLEEIIENVDKECRLLCMAYREGNFLDIQSGGTCVFIAMFIIEDILRDDIDQCIEICKSSGIELKMATGDSLHTALGIAMRVNMVKPHDTFMSGDEFRLLSDDQVIEKLENLRILYRSVPEDKVKLVNLLKKKGEVVALTGDGSNDAPALKCADIGYAMGSGTGIAKRASDVVLLKNEFFALIKSIAWGRCVSDNVRRFTQFQLSLSLSVITLSLLEVIFGYLILDLSTGRLLWLNAIGDTLGPIGISSHKPTHHTVKRAPEPLKKPIITENMIKFIFVSYLSHILTLFLLNIIGFSCLTCFNTFIFMQIFSLFLTSSLSFSFLEMLRTFLKNRTIIFICIFASILQIGYISIAPIFYSSISRMTAVDFLYSFISSISASVLIFGLLQARYKASP